MFPLRDPNRQTAHDAEFVDDIGEVDPQALCGPIANWNLARFRDAVPSTSSDTLTPGTTWEIVAGDVVSLAPELARLTVNLAMVHHDAGPEGRLVYGGHTIGIAAGQATRALPNLVTIVAWHSCDHLAPVREGDTLRSTLDLERVEPCFQGGGRLVHLRSRVRAQRGDQATNVLDWRFVGVMA